MDVQESHLNNSLMVYLHLPRPLCQCLNLCDGGAEWWCVTHSWWKITAAFRSPHNSWWRITDFYWCQIKGCDERVKGWRGERGIQREGRRSAKQGPIHHTRGEDTFQCPYSKRIHSLKVTIGGRGSGLWGEAGRGVHQCTTSPLSSLSAQTQCAFHSNSVLSIGMTNVHFTTDENVQTENRLEKTQNKIKAW